jgi:hypothetical protein
MTATERLVPAFLAAEVFHFTGGVRTLYAAGLTLTR